jgi:hypothetical protein
MGLGKAQRIFYRALSTYFNQSTTFAQARTGTIQAARDLYSNYEVMLVETAWCTVGVGDCPSPKDGLVASSYSPSPNRVYSYCALANISWEPTSLAEYYIVYYSADLNAPDSAWREVYRGSGELNSYGRRQHDLRLLSDGYIGVRACTDRLGCGTLNRPRTTIVGSLFALRSRQTRPSERRRHHPD